MIFLIIVLFPCNSGALQILTFQGQNVFLPTYDVGRLVIFLTFMCVFRSLKVIFLIVPNTTQMQHFSKFACFPEGHPAIGAIGNLRRTKARPFEMKTPKCSVPKDVYKFLIKIFMF